MQNKFSKPSGAVSVIAAQPAHQQARGGATPTTALYDSAPFRPKDIVVSPIAPAIARDICQQRHYLRSFPGGSVLNFGSFVGSSLLGVIVLGVGPSQLHRLFRGANMEEVLCLSRMWLDDRLGRNSESRVLSIVLRQLRRYQKTAKALVAYSDPSAGHSGVIYRAAGFFYIGKSSAMPRFLLPDGSTHHSRSLSHSFGTHSVRYFANQGVEVRLLKQAEKFTYVALIEPAWRQRLTRPVLPYPKEEEILGDHRHKH